MGWNDIDVARAVNNLMPLAKYEPSANYSSYDMLKSRYVGTGLKTEAEIISEGERIIAEDIQKDKAKENLQESDSEMIRVIEDLYEHIVNDIPIPQSAIDKINARKSERSKL